MERVSSFTFKIYALSGISTMDSSIVILPPSPGDGFWDCSVRDYNWIHSGNTTKSINFNYQIPTTSSKYQIPKILNVSKRQIPNTNFKYQLPNTNFEEHMSFEQTLYTMELNWVETKKIINVKLEVTHEFSGFNRNSNHFVYDEIWCLNWMIKDFSFAGFRIWLDSWFYKSWVC